MHNVAGKEGGGRRTGGREEGHTHTEVHHMHSQKCSRINLPGVGLSQVAQRQ